MTAFTGIEPHQKLRLVKKLLRERVGKGFLSRLLGNVRNVDVALLAEQALVFQFHENPPLEWRSSIYPNIASAMGAI